MDTYAVELARIATMIEDIRSIRDRTCEPKNQSNPRYHALSQAVSGLLTAADDLRTEAANNA